MTDLDDELLPAVFELIAEVGKSITFRVEGPQTYDVVEGKSWPAAIATHQWKCAPPYELRERPEDATSRLTGVWRTIAPAQGIPFDPREQKRQITATMDGRTYRLVGVSPIYSGDAVCAYELDLGQ